MKLKMNKVTPRQVLIALAIAVVIFIMFSNNTKSTYSHEGSMFAPSGAAGPSEPGSGCQMKAGTGLASSLLPREVASQEDFGEFAPEDVLAGQNFLEPRSQIGFPETVSGALRNANQQVRADPPNAKEPFVWNNSTIASDTMRRPLC
tara:strand:- start:699 stop:1139 length:441 start_codon:yes stop_codon:yes gene_type:complete